MKWGVLRANGFPAWRGCGLDFPPSLIRPARSRSTSERLRGASFLAPPSLVPAVRFARMVDESESGAGLHTRLPELRQALELGQLPATPVEDDMLIAALVDKAKQLGFGKSKPLTPDA